MKLSVCTISFRHQLISFDQIASWANINRFEGIELWGAHAKSLADEPYYNKDWLSNYGLSVSMISDYLPMLSTEFELYDNAQYLCRLAKLWGAKKIRTFAGNKSSSDTTRAEYQLLVKKFAQVCDWLAKYNLELIVETHPNTLTDSLESIKKLVHDVDKENLKLNFDVLHIWESKTNIIEALKELSDNIGHFHLKNISSEEFLDVFTPTNVYSPSGSRTGMTSLFEGKVNYRDFFDYIYSEDKSELRNIDASLEWFGNDCKSTLARDKSLINQIKQEYNTKSEII